MVYNQNNSVAKDKSTQESPKKLSPRVTVPKIVSDNIAQLIARQKQREDQLSHFHRLADWSTKASGSASFLFFHVLWFTLWILLNLNLIPGWKAFDPYPFGFLTFVVSLEAIALSVMVLMVQNQIQVDADRRAELDLHVNLLAETESTLILKKLCRLEKKMGIEVEAKEQKAVNDLLKDTNPVDIEQIIEDIT